MWDERYNTAEYVYGKEPNSFLAGNWQAIRGKRVLSLAEGEGRNAVFLAGQGFSVTGVDTSVVGLRKAQALAAERGVSIETVVHDLSSYRMAAGSWDGIVSIFCHQPKEVRRAVHARVVRALSPGGAFLLEAYAPEQLQSDTGGPRTRDLLAGLDELRRELAGLTFEHAVETERDVVEGVFHTGRAAVVQVVARKE